LMTAFYILGCLLGGGLKRLVGAHESGSAATIPAAADSRNGAKLEAERQATAKAAADRLAVEVATKAEADRKAAAAKVEAARLAAEALAKAEADRKAAAAKADADKAAKAETDRLAAEAAAKAEAERVRAEIERRAAAAAKADAERLAAAALAKAESDRLAAAAVAKAVADRRARGVKAEADRVGLTAVTKADGSAANERSRQRGRLLPLPGRRRIVLWRKPPQWPRGSEKQVPPPKPRRVVWLQRVSQRSRLGETPPSQPTRPMHRRTVWLRRLPRPRSIGAPSLHYLRRRTEQT
jgi:hypothetical protein